MTDDVARQALIEAARMIDQHEQAIQSLQRTVELQADQIANAMRRIEVIQHMMDRDDLK
jgi:hypothetical protein